MMKILHIWNTAGVPQTLAKFQQKLGYKSDVIMRKTFTSFGAESLAHKPIVIGGSAKRYALGVLARVWKYDIIHAHAFPFTDKYIKRLYRWKPFIYTMHGSWIRGKWQLPDRKKIINNCAYLSLSTPELLDGAPSFAKYHHNPVDTDHFIRSKPYKENTALFILRWKRQLPALRQALREGDEHGLDVTVIDRQTDFIPYPEFPAYLQQFEYYMDTKTLETFRPEDYVMHTEWEVSDSEVPMNPSLSVTALQQLALGGKVINDGNVLDQFPSEHDGSIVAKEWIKTYKMILA